MKKITTLILSLLLILSSIPVMAEKQAEITDEKSYVDLLSNLGVFRSSDFSSELC